MAASSTTPAAASESQTLLRRRRAGASKIRRAAVEFREMLRTGVKNLVRHKLRTMLTMLGVIFGVGAVISMMSIGEGARRATMEQIRLLGTNNIRITEAQKTAQ